MNTLIAGPRPPVNHARRGAPSRPVLVAGALLLIASLISGCGPAAPTADAAPTASHTGGQHGRLEQPGRLEQHGAGEQPGPTEQPPSGEHTASPEQAEPAATALPQPIDEAAPLVIAVQDITLDPALTTVIRSVPSVQGATDTAFLYLAAWLHGINTGDPSFLIDLSTDDCRYCAATVARLATDPRTVADGFSTQMTATLLATQEPNADHDYAVVSIGVQVDSVQVTEVDGVQTMQMLEPTTAGFRFAVQSTPSGWAIGGIANDEWDGSA